MDFTRAILIELNQNLSQRYLNILKKTLIRANLSLHEQFRQMTTTLVTSLCQVTPPD